MCANLDESANVCHISNMHLKNKISCLLIVYNEAARIRMALAGLVPWADEVVVCDKGSTDGTAELAASMGAQVRVVTIPYSDRGCENHAELLRLTKNEWVYVAVCSEVPTRRLVTEMDRVVTVWYRSPAVDTGRRFRKVWQCAHRLACCHEGRYTMSSQTITNMNDEF